MLELQKAGAIVVDTRPAMQFAVAHVPGSIHIALTGQYGPGPRGFPELDLPLIIAGEDPRTVRESQLRLARVGIENDCGIPGRLGIIGWIKNGFELEYIRESQCRFFVELQQQGSGRVAILDVRGPGGEMSDRRDRACQCTFARAARGAHRGAGSQ